MTSKTMFEFTGTVERVVFRNEKNGYSVLEVFNDESVTVVGILPGIGVGETLKLIGTFKNHPTFGEQFSVETFERVIPTTTASILKYLSSGAIKGIGPATATKLVDTFKEQTLEIIEKDPERLTVIKGISLDKARKISEEFKNLFGVKELMTYLAKFSITPNETVKVWKTFGEESLNALKSNPYILCSDPINISFEKADKIAFSLDKSNDDDCRIRAAIVYVLEHNVNNGHTCLPKERLKEAADKFLGVSIEKVSDALKSLLEEGSLLF